jgi:hypothetical protein
MTQFQFDEFSWSRGLFGLTEYDKTGAVPPALADQVWWIDHDEGWASGPLEWTVIIGVGESTANPFPSPYGQDVAIRYWPEIAYNDCCFCRSYKMRCDITAMDEAYEHYQTNDELNDAVDRLKEKLTRLIPRHARVIDWSVTTNIVHTMYGAQNAADVFHRFDDDEFDDATEILMTVEQRGHLTVLAESQNFWLRDDTPAVVWSALNRFTGVSDPDTWYVVGTPDVDVTSLIADNNPVEIECLATGPVTFGDARWTFKVTRPRN